MFASVVDLCLFLCTMYMFGGVVRTCMWCAEIEIGCVPQLPAPLVLFKMYMNTLFSCVPIGQKWATFPITDGCEHQVIARN